MFGNKAKKIAALQKRNAELEKYAPLADDIMRRIDAEVESAAGAGSFNIDVILQDTEASLRQQKFLDLFARLSVEERVRMLLEATSDEDAKGLLDSALSTELARLSEDYSIDGLLDKARKEQRLNLSLLPTDTLVSLYMYTKNEFDDDTTSKDLKRETYADATIKLVHLGTGIFRVANSIVYSSSENIFGLDDSYPAKIGTKYGEDVDPNIFFRSQLYSYNTTQYLAPIILGSGKELRLGRVKINGEEAFIKK